MSRYIRNKSLLDSGVFVLDDSSTDEANGRRVAFTHWRRMIVRLVMCRLIVVIIVFGATTGHLGGTSADATRRCYNCGRRRSCL